MDPELRKELDELRVLVKDNHHMLRGLRQAQLLGFLGRIVIWLLVLLLPFFLYLRYVGPLLVGLYKAQGGTTSGPFGLPTSADIQKLLKSYNAGQ
jgi:hypothetical protein